MNGQTQLKIGDVVMLKSGGPAMTVHNIGEYPMQGLDLGVLCVWFDDRKKIEDVFHPATLDHYDAD